MWILVQSFTTLILLCTDFKFVSINIQFFYKKSNSLNIIFSRVKYFLPYNQYFKGLIQMEQRRPSLPVVKFPRTMNKIGLESKPQLKEIRMFWFSRNVQTDIARLIWRRLIILPSGRPGGRDAAGRGKEGDWSN